MAEAEVAETAGGSEGGGSSGLMGGVLAGLFQLANTGEQGAIKAQLQSNQFQFEEKLAGRLNGWQRQNTLAYMSKGLSNQEAMSKFQTDTLNTATKDFGLPKGSWLFAGNSNLPHMSQQVGVNSWMHGALPGDTTSVELTGTDAQQSMGFGNTMD